MPVVKLTDQMKKNLEDMSEEIKTVKQEIAKAKSVGIDVSALEQKLEKALSLREMLLKHYT